MTRKRTKPTNTQVGYEYRDLRKLEGQYGDVGAGLMQAILQGAEGAAEGHLAFIANLRTFISEHASPLRSQPVDNIRWVPVEKVRPNDYNPNSVAAAEMQLLYTSIKADGYTQPVVTVYDPGADEYVIVDGFHRYFTCANNDDIRERNHGMLPVVVIDKDINDRMASTVRHNRARGKHSTTGMANMVFKMLEEGWDDAEICNELGMEAEELIRLKHVTGFSKLFENVEYQKAWETRRMIKVRLAAAEKATLAPTDVKGQMQSRARPRPKPRVRARKK